MFPGLFGPPRLYIKSANELQAQLSTELPLETASLIASIAAAIDATLIASPAIDALLVSQTAPAIAALYGTVLRTIDRGLALPGGSPEMRERIVALRHQLDQVVRLAQIELPEPVEDPQGDSPSTDDAVDVALSEMGIL